MNEEKTLCSVCAKNEMSIKCNECGVPLCDMCAREIALEQVSPGATLKGVTTTTMRAAVRKVKVCEKCMKEVDLV